MKFKLVAATDVNTFEEMVNGYVSQGYKFMANMSVMINEIEGGLQYSVAMLLEPEVKNG